VRVRVVSNPVTALAVSGPARASTGDVIRLTARGTGAGGREVANPPVRWSVSGAGASVYPDGGFVAERGGTFLVTATVGTVAATHAIAVSPRVHARRLELVTHRGFGDMQAAEHWAIGDALYVSTIGDRIYTFDISTPGNPVKVDSVVVDAHVINDVSTTADGKIGVLTREGASSRRNGLVFLDLADPLHPKVLSEFTETVTGGVHSAFVDGHYVYATDDATGSLRIIDFSDPRKPRQVARWEVKDDNVVQQTVNGQMMTGGRLLHDVQVQDGLAYLAYWRHGLIILDVGKGIKGGSPQNPQLVSRLVYNVADFYPPDMLAGTHAVFRYRNYVFLGDEVFPSVFDLSSRERIKSLGRVHVVDVSDIEHPVKVAEYNVQDKGSHNMWVDGDVMYIGYYEGGLRAVDVSGELRGDLMAQGREVGAVWTGSSEGFRPNLPMTWGAQPHKGFVYASDINSGLWVARLTPAPIP
ncbi:MAG: LVIVD repeat-containing protein, partial [Gemmatimonadaceae bacterium]